tara:strand:+ start:354 stop:782 length:429 start_codon:yes stop_codon:yes gene_type:complete
MKWTTAFVAALLLSGCVSIAETSSTSSITEDTAVSQENLPESVTAYFVCRTQEAILEFVNIDIAQEGRSLDEWKVALNQLGSKLAKEGVCISFMPFPVIPIERIASYVDQDGGKTTAWKVMFGDKEAYTITPDLKQPSGFSI